MRLTIRPHTVKMSLVRMKMYKICLKSSEGMTKFMLVTFSHAECACSSDTIVVCKTSGGEATEKTNNS